MEKDIRGQNINQYLCRMKEGDLDALSPLYDCTSKQLYALCYTYFHNREDSEDAVSETYLRVHNNITRFEGSGGYAWMCTIAKNICLNMLKRGSRVIGTDFTDEAVQNSMAEQLSEHDRYEEDVLHDLAKEILSEKEYRIVILHAVSEQKFKEIAETVDGNESTVRWQYNNALKKLRKECERRGIP